MPTEFRHVSVETLLRLIQETGPQFARAKAKKKTNKNSGTTDQSRSALAFRKGIQLCRAGAPFDEMVAGLLADPETSEWTRTKGQANNQRELLRIWKRAEQEAKSRSNNTSDVVTEDLVALIFAETFHDKLRYCHDTGCWFEWTGTYWRREKTKLAFSWARELARNAAEAIGKAAAATGKASFAAGVERMAQSDRVFVATSETWDTDPWLLGTPGGTIDLRTAELLDPVREDYITKLTSIAPSVMPDCPQWLAFLDQATQGDAGQIRFLKQWCGYCLTGDIREHALLFVYGPGGNGKGVFLNIMSWIMGDYACNAAMDTFVVSAGDKHPTDLAMLRGARLVTASETEEGRPWAEARIKALTGGDTITARFMRQDFFQFKPHFKLTIIGNHRPVLRNVDEAARRRFNMAPFLYQPPAKDLELEAKLQAEGPGILRWMIEGCLDWQMNGLIRPKVVTEATTEYLAEQDLVSHWIEESCDLGPHKCDTLAALFKSWGDFAMANGEKQGSSKWFTQTLTRLGCEAVKSTPGYRGKRGFKGICVRPLVVNDRTQSNTTS